MTDAGRQSKMASMNPFSFTDASLGQSHEQFMKTRFASGISIVVSISFSFALSLSVVAAASTWEYEQRADKMDGSLTKFAKVVSDNSMALASPYSGENRARLVIRQRKSDGLNVIFVIQKGQLICSYGSSCSVMVRFDDAQPVRFGASKPSDGSSNSLFINSERRFVDLAKKAKQIKMAATVYQAGTQVLEFSTPDPLMWEAPKPKVAPAKDVQKQDPSEGPRMQGRLSSCNVAAGDRRGDDRKTFMMECLKAGPQ
jgi:psiF repeat